MAHPSGLSADSAAAANPSKGISLLVLAGFMALVFAVAGLGGYLTSSSTGDWYPTLAKPPGTPPAWVFGPVWTALYILMAVAAWGDWRTGPSPLRKRALSIWFVQLALNLAWSFCFFWLRQPLLGGLEIGVLWAAILLTILWFWPVRRWAAWLLIPYLLWVSYAAYLNWGIVVLQTVRG